MQRGVEGRAGRPNTVAWQCVHAHIGKGKIMELQVIEMQCNVAVICGSPVPVDDSAGGLLREPKDKPYCTICSFLCERQGKICLNVCTPAQQLTSHLRIVFIFL